MNFLKNLFKQPELKVLAEVDASDKFLAEINARNLARAEEAKQKLGEKYILHSVHAIKKLDKPL